MTERLGDIHCLLKDDNTERYSRYPCDEAYLKELAISFQGIGWYDMLFRPRTILARRKSSNPD